MRKLILTTAAVASAIGLAGCGSGTFTDGRDGQTYKTVKIGKQTWMAENLNYQTESGSWCYDNKADNCKKYGRLYDWKTATTVCPKGWRLPSREDWDKLVATAGGEEMAGKKLKSMSGWNNRDDGESGNGTDDYGFSALPGGGRDYSYGNFNDAGYNGYWWTATEDGSAYNWGIHYDNNDMDEYGGNKGYGFSVRCVQD